MTDTSEKIDYSKTLNLPQTDFPMRAGLPKREPELYLDPRIRWHAGRVEYNL